MLEEGSPASGLSHESQSSHGINGTRNWRFSYAHETRIACFLDGLFGIRRDLSKDLACVIYSVSESLQMHDVSIIITVSVVIYPYCVFIGIRSNPHPIYSNVISICILFVVPSVNGCPRVNDDLIVSYALFIHVLLLLLLTLLLVLKVILVIVIFLVPTLFVSALVRILTSVLYFLIRVHFSLLFPFPLPLPILIIVLITVLVIIVVYQIVFVHDVVH